MRNIFYIVPSDFESLEKKGVLNLILERDEGRFFDNILTLHPFTKNNKTILLKENNKIIEYGWKSKSNFLNNFLIAKIFGTLSILFKLLFVFPFIIKKEKISIIRATDPYYMGLIGLYYSKLLKIPLVVSVHSDYEKRFILDGSKGSFTILGSRKFAKILEKYIYKKVDKIIPIREYMKQDIINNYKINKNKIEVFPHGIDFDKFENIEDIDIYQKFNINKEKKIISFIGRLSKENYVYHLFEIAIKLKELKNDFILLVLGEGNEYKNMQKILIEKNLNDVMMLTGFQNKDTVANVRKQNYLSLCLMGGFSLIEACAGARPAISYDIEWHSELVQNNKTGCLIEENDIDEIVKQIRYLFDNPKEADKLGVNAKKLAFVNHDISNATNTKQAIYKDVLSEYKNR